MQVCKFNASLVSPFYFAFILCNICFNAYSVCYLTFIEVFNFSICSLQLALLAEIVTPIFVVYYLIKLNISIKSCCSNFHRKLFRLNHKRFVNISKAVIFREKLKALVYFEFLYQKEVKFISLRAGPLGLFTRKTLIEVNIYFYDF